MAKLITSPSHGQGNTCLTFSKDGTRAFTGGEDCIVRIWKTNEGAEQEPETAVDADGGISSITVADDCWISGSVDTQVRRYSRNRNEYEAPVTGAGGVPVRCVAIDPKGKKVAVGSDELFLKVIDMEDIANVYRLEGHERGVRKVTWHPSEPLLTTCGSDGKIIIWDLSAEQPKVEKFIDGIIPAVIDQESPEFAYDCSAIWHTSGQYFFTATKGHEIITISRSDWSKTSTFTDKEVSGPITALALSVNGVYIASASQSKVHVWSTQTRRRIATCKANSTAAITHLAFSPKDNLIAWTDTDGVFSRWPNPIEDNFPDPVRSSIATNAAATLPGKPKTGLNLFGEDISTTGDAPDLGLDDAMPEVDDDWIVDDLDGALRDETDIGKKASNEYVKEMVSITKAQPPFQPGATPMENKKRYLAYNMIGVVEVTDQDTHQIINVDFFDKSTRKGFYFTDHFKYNLGYLGERGAVFACSPENESPAQVFYKPYGNWGKQAEWTYVLKRPGSRVLGVATNGLPPTSTLRERGDSDLQGFGDVVIATSEGDLTFLTGTGRERRIMGLGGDFVSMVASPEWVFVVHRAGSTTIDGSQNLSYLIINLEDFSVRQRDVLPIPKGHTLKWIGLTDQLAPAMYDSTGCIHILTKYRIPHHASWARTMDTNLLERRKGKDESYWPIGITGNEFMCLILKGRQEYPSFPRPLIQELQMQIPFRREEPKEEQLERTLLLNQIAVDSLDDEITTDEIVARELALDKELIMLIQAACKGDNIPRAIELTKLLHQLSTFDSAMKIAEFYHLVGFKEKVMFLKNEREENEERMVAARNKRRRWLKPDPPLRQIVATNGATSRVDLLGDVRPPPAIERPGMARVTVPVIETSTYSMANGSTPTHQAWRDPLEDTLIIESPASQEGKRKRSENEELTEQHDFSMPPPKQKSNPFARKAGQDTSRNPFARKQETNKTIYKSESFFEKVDAVEADVAKPKRSTLKGKEKEKEKTGIHKQTTLFGMLPKAPVDKRTRKRRTEETENESSQVESQATDISMSDAQMTDSLITDGWEETQSSETQETQLTETQETDVSSSL